MLVFTTVNNTDTFKSTDTNVWLASLWLISLYSPVSILHYIFRRTIFRIIMTAVINFSNLWCLCFMLSPSVTEHEDNDKVTINCSVVTYEKCHHTVRCLFKGRAVDRDNSQIVTLQTGCSTTVSLLKSHHVYSSRDYLLDCEVNDAHTEGKLFTFSPQLSGEKTGDKIINCLRWLNPPKTFICLLLYLCKKNFKQQMKTCWLCLFHFISGDRQRTNNPTRKNPAGYSQSNTQGIYSVTYFLLACMGIQSHEKERFHRARFSPVKTA